MYCKQVLRACKPRAAVNHLEFRAKTGAQIGPQRIWIIPVSRRRGVKGYSVKYDLLVVFVALVLMPNQAEAYIDPGSASMAIQAIIAAIAGCMIAIRRLRTFVIDGINWLTNRLFHHDC
jgi:hypothetical protein